MKLIQFINHLEYDFEKHIIIDRTFIRELIDDLLKSPSQSFSTTNLIAILKLFNDQTEIPDDPIYDFLSEQKIKPPLYNWSNFSDLIIDAVIHKPQLKLLRDLVFRGVTCQRLWQATLSEPIISDFWNEVSSFAPSDKITWTMEILNFVEEIRIIQSVEGYIRILFNRNKIILAPHLTRFSKVIQSIILNYDRWYDTIEINLVDARLYNEIKILIKRKHPMSMKFVNSLFDDNLKHFFKSQKILLGHN